MDTGAVHGLVGDLAPVPAMPFAARGVDAPAEEVEVGAGQLGGAGGGGGFEFGALSPGELWASQDFEGEVDGGHVLGVDLACVLAGPGIVGREAASACQWPASERGFVNGGNQCYMIAAVQLLGSVAEVRASLQRIPVARGGDMLRAMHADFNDVRSRATGVPPCAFAGICERYQAFGFQRGQMGDAHEAVLALLGKWRSWLQVVPPSPAMGLVAPEVTEDYVLFGHCLEKAVGCFGVSG